MRGARPDDIEPTSRRVKAGVVTVVTIVVAHESGVAQRTSPPTPRPRAGSQHRQPVVDPKMAPIRR
jgi:hypothetical protein